MFICEDCGSDELYTTLCRKCQDNYDEVSLGQLRHRVELENKIKTLESKLQLAVKGLKHYSGVSSGWIEVEDGFIEATNETAINALRKIEGKQ